MLWCLDDLGLLKPPGHQSKDKASTLGKAQETLRKPAPSRTRRKHITNTSPWSKLPSSLIFWEFLSLVPKASYQIQDLIHRLTLFLCTICSFLFPLLLVLVSNMDGQSLPVPIDVAALKEGEAPPCALKEEGRGHYLGMRPEPNQSSSCCGGGLPPC